MLRLRLRLRLALRRRRLGIGVHAHVDLEIDAHARFVAGQLRVGERQREIPGRRLQRRGTLRAFFEHPLELLPHVGGHLLEHHACTVGAVRAEVLVETHADDATAQREGLARAERLRNLERDALARLEREARKQAATAARQVGERRAAREQPGAEGDLEADGDARLAAALVPRVETVQEQQAQGLGVHGTAHEVVEADLAHLGAQRVRIFAHHHDARERVARGVSACGQAHGVDAPGRGDQQAGRRGRVARDGATAHASVGDAQIVEDLLDVVELAIVEQ